MANGISVHQGRLAAVSLEAELPWAAGIIAAAVLFYLVSSTAVSLVLLVALAIPCWYRPSIAIALVPLAVPLHMLPKIFHTNHPRSFSLGEIVILLLTVIVLVQQMLSAQARPRDVSLVRHFVPSTPFLGPAVAFLLAATVATLAARFHTVAFREYREMIVEPIVYYWLISQRLNHAVGAAMLALSVVAAGTVVSVLGALQIHFRPQDMAFAQNLVPPQRLVVAVYGNENNLGLLIDRALPMALALALAPGWIALFTRGQDARPTLFVGRLVQGGLLIASALMLYILYRTQSRGGEAATALCAGILFVVWQIRRPVVLGIGAVAVAIAAFLARHRIASYAQGGHGFSNDAHQSIWQSALRMIRDHPVFGVGPDNFLYYYSNDNTCAPGHIAHWYYVQAGTNFERCISHPHNMFMDYWLSTGILGLAAGLTLLAMAVVLGARAYRRANGALKGPILAALVALAAFVAHGQVDNSYFLPDMAVYFWLCLGIIAVAQNDAASGTTDRPASWRGAEPDAAALENGAPDSS